MSHSTLSDRTNVERWEHLGSHSLSDAKPGGVVNQPDTMDSAHLCSASRLNKKLKGTAFIRIIQLGIASVLFMQTGCFSLSSMLGARREPTLDLTPLKAQGFSIPPGGMARPLPDGMELDGKSIAVEIRGDEPRIATVPLPENNSVTIEDLYRKLELTDSLGASQVSIMRPSPSGPPVRLSLMVNGKGQATNPGQNYALRPGDHVVASSDGRSLLERYIDRQFGKE